MKVQTASEAAGVISAKHESLQLLAAAVVRRLTEGGLLIVDWKESDAFALGFALSSRPHRVAFVWRDYFDSFMLSTGPVDSDPFADVESDPFTDADALARAVVSDLRRL